MLIKNNSDIRIKRPEAVLFDTDNTLYDYNSANAIALEAVAMKATKILNISTNEFYKYYKLAREETKLQLGKTASSHSRLLYFQKMLELKGFKAQLMISLDFEQTFWRTFLANAPLFEDVILVLNYLKFHSIPIAVVTDLTSHIQLRKLTYFHLEDTFDAVVCSEEVGADKPDKRIFDLCYKKLNLDLDCKDVWMIGDSASADIIGGKRIGAITYQKIHNGVVKGKGDELPDYYFNNFKDLLIQLKSIF